MKWCWSSLSLTTSLILAPLLLNPALLSKTSSAIFIYWAVKASSVIAKKIVKVGSVTFLVCGMENEKASTLPDSRLQCFSNFSLRVMVCVINLCWKPERSLMGVSITLQLLTLLSIIILQNARLCKSFLDFLGGLEPEFNFSFNFDF